MRVLVFYVYGAIMQTAFFVLTNVAAGVGLNSDDRVSDDSNLKRQNDSSFSRSDRVSYSILFLFPVQLYFASAVALEVFYIRPAFSMEFWQTAVTVLVFESYRDSMLYWNLSDASEGIRRCFRRGCGKKNLNANESESEGDIIDSE